jgi:hypothetical protein
LYKVIKHFADLQDNNYSYQVGDIFPRDGVNVLPSRLKELAGTENRRGEALIAEVAEPKKAKSAKTDEAE